MKKELGITYDKLINSPLYKLAETKLLKERKFITIGKTKFVEPILVLSEMLNIIRQADKNGRHKLLKKYIQGAY